MHGYSAALSASAMADDCDVSKIVTTFLLSTCKLHPRLSHRDVQGAMRCAMLSGLHPVDDEEAELISLTTGSVAEFYIEPMLPLVGDIDVMTHLNTWLAIPRGHPPPTQLPAEFHNYVKVVEIIDSHLPRYVYLPLRYLLTRCIDDSKYRCIEYDERYYLGSDGLVAGGLPRHGPAGFFDKSHTSYLSVDVEYCMRCLSWPLQAPDWPTRHRNYGWPDSAILDRVVSNGCDMVGVAQHLCREQEWLGKYQWRLSFSRAEIVLINSWVPVQQIVYHLLRYFVKTERLTDSADNCGAGKLSNYHIKTVTLWACEVKSRSWWTEDLNLVRISVELFHTLSVWLTDIRCPHYFINNCNVVDKSFNVASAIYILTSIDEEHLSTWFINNYIGQCAQLCPVYTLRLFDDVSSTVKLQNVVLEIVHWRLCTSLHDLWRTFYISELTISSAVSFEPLNVRSCVCWMHKLTRIHKRLPLYFSAVVLLQVACYFIRNCFTDRMMDILLRLNFNQICSDLSLRISKQNTSELVGLLQKSAVEHLTTYRQLVARDFGSVGTIVTTDFEALYAYKRGDYQRCLQLSTQNVHMLLNAVHIALVGLPTFSEFIQLLVDDIVSLTALTLIINPKCRRLSFNVYITQLTLSLYLMTQCQLKLHHSVTSLAQTLHNIKVAQIIYPRKGTLDHLTLKLIERKVCLTT